MILKVESAPLFNLNWLKAIFNDVCFFLVRGCAYYQSVSWLRWETPQQATAQWGWRWWPGYFGLHTQELRLREQEEKNNNINNMLIISSWHFKEMHVVTGRKSLTGAADRQSTVQRGGAEGQVVLNSSWERVPILHLRHLQQKLGSTGKT